MPIRFNLEPACQPAHGPMWVLRFPRPERQLRRPTAFRARLNFTASKVNSVSLCNRFYEINAPQFRFASTDASSRRSEEHTSELQSPVHLVCRLLLEKKKDVV